MVTLVAERWPGDRYLRPLVAVGFCGGFTTFSTLAVEIDQRIRARPRRRWRPVYLAVSLVAGLGAALAGDDRWPADACCLPAGGAPSPTPTCWPGTSRADDGGVR